MTSRFDPCGPCCNCLLFTEDYISALASPWDVRSGTVNFLGAEEWELEADTLVIVDRPVITGAGSLQAGFAQLDDTDEVGIVFGYLDDDNYNFAIFRWLPAPPFTNATIEYWERRVGVDAMIEDKEIASPGGFMAICWQMGDDTIEAHARIEVVTDTPLLYRHLHVGVSSFPGKQFGLITQDGPVVATSGGGLNMDFEAARNKSDCVCGCYAPGFEPHSPPELSAVFTGVPGGCTRAWLFDGTFVLKCFDVTAEAAGHWSFNTVEHVVTIVVGASYVLRYDYLEQSSGTTARWEIDLGATLPKLWCLNVTLTSTHLLSNDTGCDLSAAEIALTNVSVTGITPTCP